MLVPLPTAHLGRALSSRRPGEQASRQAGPKRRPRAHRCRLGSGGAPCSPPPVVCSDLDGVVTSLLGRPLDALTQIRGRSAGCPAPPAQIRTCALTHPAPALSVDGKSLRRPRVEDGHGGPVLPAQGVQTFPWVACPLRPSADSPHPEPPQGPHELRQRRAACGHRVIAKPSAEHPSKPPCCHHRVVMHAPTQLGLDGLEGPSHPLRDRFPAQTEAAHCASSGSSA